jgi:hypothetical protein
MSYIDLVCETPFLVGFGVAAFPIVVHVFVLVTFRGDD